MITPDVLRLCADPGCANPVDGDAVICASTLAALRARLRQIRELVRELVVTLTRQARSPQGPGGGGDEAPLLYQPDAADAGRDLYAVLRHVAAQLLTVLGLTWADIAARRPGRTGIPTYLRRTDMVATVTAPFPDARLITLAAWLDRHPDTIATHPQAGTMVDEITDAVARCWYAVDRPDATRRYLGRCETCTPTALAAAGLGESAAELWAREDAAWVTCRVCGTSVPTEARRAQMLKRAENLLVTAEQASRALPLMIADQVDLTPDVIRRWVADRGLDRHPPRRGDPHRRPRYRVGDILDQIARARARAADRARPPAARLRTQAPQVAALFEQARAAAARTHP